MQRWLYSQSLGFMWSPDNKLASTVCYSGFSDGLNNGALEHVKNVGPIPCGDYVICDPIRSEKTGPHVLPLLPTGHKALGRTAFQIHGDNHKGDKSASMGCVVAPRHLRELISESDIRIFRVVA